MLTRLNDLDRLFSTLHFLQRGLDAAPAVWPGRQPVDWQSDAAPKANLYDLGDSFEMSAEVPGIKKEDLAVKIQGNYLEISGKREFAAPEGYKAHRGERQNIAFTRSFTLPADIDPEKAAAKLEDGILTLTLPKAATAKARQITIG
jgi:HSP20 family protein